MSEKKYVEVTVKVPEGIMQFLKDIIPSTNYDSVQEYLKDTIISRVEADIDGDIFNPTVKAVAERYGLKEEFGIEDS
jgi:hypothetical protein